MSTPRPNKDARVAGKRKWSLMPLAVFGEIIDVMQWAIEREVPTPYARDSWRDLDDWRELYSEALLRHLTSWQSGEERDPESGKLHAAHIGACAVILIARTLEDPVLAAAARAPLGPPESDGGRAALLAAMAEKRGPTRCWRCNAPDGRGPTETDEPSRLCPDCAAGGARRSRPLVILPSGDRYELAREDAHRRRERTEWP